MLKNPPYDLLCNSKSVRSLAIALAAYDDMQQEAILRLNRENSAAVLAFLAPRQASAQVVSEQLRLFVNNARQLAAAIQQVEITQDELQQQQYERGADRYKRITGYDITSPEFAAIDQAMSDALMRS